MLMSPWSGMGGCGCLIKLVMTWLIALLILDGGGCRPLSLTVKGWFTLLALLGILLSLTNSGSLLPLLERLSTGMVEVVLLFTPRCGLLPVSLSVGELCKLYGHVLGSQALPGLWDAGTVCWLDIVVTPDDVPFWPFSVCSLVKICAFLWALHWHATVDDLKSWRCFSH